jgi:hypothetical protein
MTSRMMATIYPGGELAILSALLWLFFTVLASLSLLIGCAGVFAHFIGNSLAIKTLNLANWFAIAAMLILILETCSVGWDAFFLLVDRAYFLEQFPANFKRAGANLISFGLSLPLYFTSKRQAPHVHQANE